MEPSVDATRKSEFQTTALETKGLFTPDPARRGATRRPFHGNPTQYGTVPCRIRRERTLTYTVLYGFGVLTALLRRSENIAMTVSRE